MWRSRGSLAGLNFVFLAGPADDTKPFEGFEVWKNVSLERVKSLMAGASLFIGNDSGPAHIAAAFGVPVVAIFGASIRLRGVLGGTESQVLQSAGGIADISVQYVMDGD